MNSNDNIFIQKRIEPSSIRNKYKIDYEDELNKHLYTENNIFQKKKSLIKSKTSSSYKTLINTYSKDKNRYKNIYENKSRAIPSLYLQRAYLKNQKDYNEYLNDKNNKRGLKLEGNKDYNDIPIEQYMDEIETYRENIKKLIMQNDWYYITFDEYNDNNKKMKLTPLPSKSRLLMNTNKEKKDFNFAERNAVFMRMVEYTHSLITQEKQKEDKSKLDKEKKKIYLIMKSAILTIENWWASILEKRKEKEEKLNQFIEKNYINLENLVNKLEIILNKKRKDENIKISMIEFFRKLYKNNQKYEKKKKKINNNVNVKNVVRDDEIPEILGPEYMVEMWKRDEENVKKNNNSNYKIIKQNIKQNYAKKKTLSSNIPKKLFHYIENNDEMKIYRNNDSNSKVQYILSEDNKSSNNKKSKKMGILRNSNKDIVKAIRINHFNNFDENQLEAYYNTNNKNKNHINKIRNNKIGINKNTKSTSRLETNNNKKIQNIDEKFKYILEKSNKGIQNTNLKKKYFNDNYNNNNVNEMNKIQNSNTNQNYILNHINPEYIKDNNENNIDKKVENNHIKHNNKYEGKKNNNNISEDEENSKVNNMIENDDLYSCLKIDELNNLNNKNDNKENKNENNNLYNNNEKINHSNIIINSNKNKSNLKKDINNNGIQKENKTEKNNKLSLNNLTKNTKKEINKKIQKSQNLNDVNNNKNKNLNNKNKIYVNNKQSELKDNNIEIQNTNIEDENNLNPNPQNKRQNNNDVNNNFNQNKKISINDIPIKQINDNNNNSEKSNLIDDENIEETNNIIVNNKNQNSNFNDSNNELKNNEQINKNKLENTYKKFPSNQDYKNEYLKKNVNFTSPIEPPKNNIGVNEKNNDEEIKPKYSYNSNDKKLMRIDSKGIIENIENILEEDSKQLTIKSKKKKIKNDKNDNNKNNNIQNNKDENIQINKNQNNKIKNIQNNDNKIEKGKNINIDRNNNKFDNKKLQLINTENILIPHDRKEDIGKSLTLEERIEKFVFLIGAYEKEKFFNRLVLNYLYKHNVNLNDEELIALLKLGQNNTYQRILNKSLGLNLIKDEYHDKNISFKDWVKKFVGNKKDLDNKEELINKYNEYIKKNSNHIINNKSIIKNNDIKRGDKNQLFSNEKDSNLNDSNDKNNDNNLDNRKVFDLEKYKSNFKLKNNRMPLLKNKRDTSKDIIIPEDINIAYNLLRQTKVITKELHREFKDEAEKF